MVFVEIILPLALKGTFTYSVPDSLVAYVKPGVRVEVQFGQRRHYAGIVSAITATPPEGFRVKPILDVLDAIPVVTSEQLEFWRWMSEYYMCYLGEVMQAALPAQLKLESTTVFAINPSYDQDVLSLDDDEYLVASALQHQPALSWEEISQILQGKHIVKTIKNLLDEGVMLVSEVIEDPYKPKMSAFVAWTSKYAENESAQKELLDSLVNKPQQMRLILAFIGHIRQHVNVARQVLLKSAGVTPGVLQTLVKNGVLQIAEIAVNRVPIPEELSEIHHTLSIPQKESLSQICAFHKENKAVLLYGVTASGKTHLYIELILEAKAAGKQVLFLLPEIALTAQLINRLNNVLGGVGVYHSRMSQAERTEIWYKVLKGELKVVVGARSAIFLPFASLELVIVDEEHDQSYKQQDPAPRYQARDASLVLSRLHHGHIVLGSATPSVESYYNAESGRYGLVNLETTFHDTSKLKFIIEPLQKWGYKHTPGALITPMVRKKMEEILLNNKQVIVFQNRRGYAPYLICSTCSWIPFCKNCDVPLTYHKGIDKLKCHYCGYTEKPPVRCRECDATAMIQRGIGTERIEDDLKLMFPQARVGRLDQDAARARKGHVRITRDFEEHELDILVGTQMIAKGLDFSAVSLVVVPEVDGLLFYPDFRATERAFQLLYQVSGRTGRRKEQGEVCLQTAKPEHPILHWVINRDYPGFYRQEIDTRLTYNYPPFCRLLKCTFLHKDKTISRTAADIFAKGISENEYGQVLGPAEPGIGKVRNLYLQEVMVKMPRTAQAQQLKKTIAKFISNMLEEAAFRQLRVIINVDPY